MTLSLHKYIQRNHFSYYTCQTAVYCTICCLLIVKQWQKGQNSIHHSLRQKRTNQSFTLSLLRVIPLGLALLYRHYPLTWRILLLTFYYYYCSCFLFLFVYCYGKMQFFIHCNFFCQEYKFAYLLYWESRCRGICASTASFLFSLNLLCYITNVNI